MVLYISGRDGDRTFEKKRKINYSRLLYSKIILSWKQWKCSNFGKDFLGLFWRTRNTPLKVWLQALVEGIAGICLKWVVLLVSWVPPFGLESAKALSCHNSWSKTRFVVRAVETRGSVFFVDLLFPISRQNGISHSIGSVKLCCFWVWGGLYSFPSFFPSLSFALLLFLPLFFHFFCNTISYTLLLYSYAEA